MATVNIEIGRLTGTHNNQGNEKNGYNCSYEKKGSAHRNLPAVRFHLCKFIELGEAVQHCFASNTEIPGPQCQVIGFSKEPRTNSLGACNGHLA